MTDQLVLTFEVRCPRGGHPMRLVQTADPKGWAHRERRAIIQCTLPHCGYNAVVEVHLVDIGAGDPAGAARKRRQREQATVT